MAQTKQFASFIELPWRYIIGGSENGSWMKSEAAGKKLKAKQTEYCLYTLGGEIGKVYGSKAAPDAEVCPDVWLQTVTPQPDLEVPAIGVNAAWDPQPRKPQVLDNEQETYAKAVADLLKEQGLGKTKVQITKIVRVDLEGDGQMEVILSGTHFVHKDELMTAESGDYSFVAIRKIIDKQVRTQILDGEFYPKKEPDVAPSIHEISGVLDLNGDGVLEVLVNTTYYEGGGLKVWEMKNEKAVVALAIDCGV